MYTHTHTHTHTCTHAHTYIGIICRIYHTLCFRSGQCVHVIVATRACRQSNRGSHDSGKRVNGDFRRIIPPPTRLSFERAAICPRDSSVAVLKLLSLLTQANFAILRLRRPCTHARRMLNATYEKHSRISSELGPRFCFSAQTGKLFLSPPPSHSLSLSLSLSCCYTMRPLETESDNGCRREIAVKF